MHVGDMNDRINGKTFYTRTHARTHTHTSRIDHFQVMAWLSEHKRPTRHPLISFLRKFEHHHRLPLQVTIPSLISTGWFRGRIRASFTHEELNLSQSN